MSILLFLDLLKVNTGFFIKYGPDYFVSLVFGSLKVNADLFLIKYGPGYFGSLVFGTFKY